MKKLLLLISLTYVSIADAVKSLAEITAELKAKTAALRARTATTTTTTSQTPASSSATAATPACVAASTTTTTTTSAPSSSKQLPTIAAIPASTTPVPLPLPDVCATIPQSDTPAAAQPAPIFCPPVTSATSTDLNGKYVDKPIQGLLDYFYFNINSARYHEFGQNAYDLTKILKYYADTLNRLESQEEINTFANKKFYKLLEYLQLTLQLIDKVIILPIEFNDETKAMVKILGKQFRETMESLNYKLIEFYRNKTEIIFHKDNDIFSPNNDIDWFSNAQKFLLTPLPEEKDNREAYVTVMNNFIRNLNRLSEKMPFATKSGLEWKQYFENLQLIE